MKISKIMAVAAATAVAATFSISAFAGTADEFMTVTEAKPGDATVVVYGTNEDTEEPNGYINSNGYSLTDVCGVQFKVQLDDAELADEEFWIGGGIGVNSDSTGWKSVEWGKASGEKAIAIDDTLEGNVATIVWMNEGNAPIFTAEDTWAQAWVQTWGGTVKVLEADLLDKDGKVIGEAAAPATEAPATEAPATEAPATDAPATEAPATEAPSTEVPGESSGAVDNTQTGVALAVVPAALAAAGLATAGIVLKKTK